MSGNHLNLTLYIPFFLILCPVISQTGRNVTSLWILARRVFGLLDMLLLVGQSLGNVPAALRARTCRCADGIEKAVRLFAGSGFIGSVIRLSFLQIERSKHSQCIIL